MFLPDVNVWLALAFDVHVHHPAAIAWYRESNDPCCFCRLTQEGFLRLATNPAVLRDEAVPLKKAWRLFDTMLSDPRVIFAEEPEAIETHWRAYTQRRTFSPKVWNDAYLAAFAKAGDFELVTFDKGLRQFKGVKCAVLA